jgi:prepilin-type processing-associated H-X9-DG protein
MGLPQPPPVKSASTAGNAMAVTSLILGILSICLGPFAAVPGIIAGLISINQAKGTGGASSGMALAGIIIGPALCVLWIAVVGLQAAILLPAIARARDAAWRSECQNNEKQIGLVCKMFANENRQQYFPELSPEAGRLMFTVDPTNDSASVYPEYLMDPSVLSCPNDEDAPTSDHEMGDPYLFIDDHSYYYFGYVITSDEEMANFAEAYRARIAAGLSFNEDLEVAEGRGTNGGNRIFRLREGVERFAITDITNPAGAAMAQSSVPVLMDSPNYSSGYAEFNHIPGGANVLYMDGHVEFVKLGTWPVTQETLAILRSLDEMGP